MTRLITALTFAILAGPAWAQATTGTGGGPTSTIYAPNTTSVGQTKAPSSGAGAATADSRTGQTEQQRQDDKISRGICIGCGPK